ncbi:MAG: hypothetical protein ACI8T1_000385 [Verrucomicrobiales bacterium]|jgi:hypothetical protein
MTRRSAFHALLLGATIALSPWGNVVHAFVVDALSFALEGAEKHVSKGGGYTMRKDFWQGAVESGEGHAIKHHLIKGNSYWFWVGTESDDVTMAIAIYDKKGTKNFETKVERGKNWIGARVEAPKSGTYLIAFKITTKDGKESHWAVAYAFK